MWYRCSWRRWKCSWVVWEFGRVLVPIKYKRRRGRHCCKKSRQRKTGLKTGLKPSGGLPKCVHPSINFRRTKWARPHKRSSSAFAGGDRAEKTACGRVQKTHARALDAWNRSYPTEDVKNDKGNEGAYGWCTSVAKYWCEFSFNLSVITCTCWSSFL